jgi:ParB-like chromosome segregation protein Spo0J
MTAQPDTAAVLTLEAFAPAALLLDISRRDDADGTVDGTFVAQLAAHAKNAPAVPVHGAADGETARCGNHTPVVIVTRDDGSLVVLLGTRRTIGCARAGVPVLGYIAGPEGTAKAAMADQLIAQITENRARQGYTVDEETAAVATLFDLSVTPAQIAKRTGLSRPEVDAARVVAGSEFARAAGERYELDLLQRAELAEFDEANDAGGAAAAIAVARDDPGQFAHVVQQLRDSRASRARKAALTAQLEEAGYQVTDRAYSTGWWHLANLLDGDGNPITDEAHAACPGRAVSIGTDWGWRDEAAEAAYRAANDIGPEDDYDVEFETNADGEAAGWIQSWAVEHHYCADPDGNGHTRRSGRVTSETKPEPGSAAALAASEERKALLRKNRDWRSANETRTAFLKELLARKTLGKALEDPAAWFRAQAIARNETEPQTMGEGHKIAAQLLGLDGAAFGSRDEMLALLYKASPARRRVIELAMCLGADEHGARDVHTWQQAEKKSRWYRPDRTGRYLAFLHDHCGYGLSELEATVAATAVVPPEDDAEAASRDAIGGEDVVHLPGDDEGEGGGDRRGELAESEDSADADGDRDDDDPETGDGEGGPWPGDEDYQAEPSANYAGDEQ